MAQKKEKKSLGSSVASDMRDNELTEERMPTSVSRPEEAEQK